MAYSQDDVLRAAIEAMDPEFRQEHQELLRVVQQPIEHEQTENNQSCSCTDPHTPAPEADFCPVAPLADIPNNETDYSDEMNWEEINNHSSGKESRKTMRYGKTQDQYFDAFLSDIEKKVSSIKSLRPESFKCSVCADEQADLFCKSCINYFCKKCHLSCSGENHHVTKYQSSLLVEKVTSRRSVLRLPHTFGESYSTVNIDTCNALCSCEGDSSPTPTPIFLMLHDDRRISAAQIQYCRACCGDFQALWAYGFLLFEASFAISNDFCEFMRHMGESSFTSLRTAITSQNQGTGFSFPKGHLSLAKYCSQQIRTRLTHPISCPCCVVASTQRNEPPCINSDFSVVVHDKNGVSCDRVGHLNARYVADEHEFAAESKIWAEACHAGGSKSTPQTENKEKPKRRGREKCPDKFESPPDNVGKHIDVRKILVHSCCHQFVLLVCLSRALGERAQYIMASLGLLIMQLQLHPEKFSFDDACHLIKTAMAARNHLPQEMRERWVDKFLKTLTYGPFHGPNHGVKCFLKFFCKGKRAEFFGDTIEAIFKGIKINTKTLRKMIFSFFVCELDERFSDWNIGKTLEMALNYISYQIKNKTEIAKLRNEVLEYCDKADVSYDDKPLNEVLDLILSWDKVELVKLRMENANLKMVGLLLRRYYVRIQVKKQNQETEHLSKKILPSPTLWEHFCSGYDDAEIELKKMDKLIREVLLSVSDEYKGMNRWKEEPLMLLRDDMQDLLKDYLLESLRLLREELFNLIRDQAIVGRTYYKAEAKGTNHLRAKVWPQGRDARQMIDSYIVTYTALRMHLKSHFKVHDSMMAVVSEIRQQAMDVNFIWDASLTQQSSVRASLYQKAFKLRSRIEMIPELDLWVRSWAANVLIRLRRAMQGLEANDDERVAHEASLRFYFEAGMKFIKSTRAKDSEQLHVYEPFKEYFQKIVGGHYSDLTNEEICQDADEKDIPIPWGIILEKKETVVSTVLVAG